VKLRISDDRTKIVLTDSTSEEYNQLKNIFTPYVKNYRFMPRFKMGIWNGKMDYFKNGIMNIGLWKSIYDVCEEYGYKFKIENKDLFPKNHELKKDDVVKFCEEFYKNHRLADKKDKDGNVIEKGGKFMPYDHQIDAIYRLLKYKLGLVEIATAGGKSLVLATMVFYILKNINPEAKFLFVVPNISLVTQLYDDFLDYNIGYNKENKNPLNIQLLEIMSDKPRKLRDDEEPNIFIGTYQSLEKLPTKFFHQFQFVATDEAHRAKSASINTILNKMMKTTTYRIGVSGTFPEKFSNERLTIESLMGPNLFTIGAKKLQDKGIISQVNITSLLLNYDDHEFAKNIYALKKRGGGKRGFELEKEYIHNSEKRKYFIKKLIENKFKSNSLVLFHSVEYGKALYDFCRDNIADVDFYYVDGGVKSEKREFIKKELEKTGGKVKVGITSFGTFSTGINVKAISNIVFVDSFKSDQIIRQSIGRGLRLHKEKLILNVYDIVDIFHKKYTNTLYQHYKYRRDKIYKPQQFPVDEVKISLKIGNNKKK
jgi:superfamily II DNA or RNA helicase